MKIIERFLPLFGIAGAVFYFSHVIFGTMLYTDYDSMSQAISDLTAANSPSRKIAFPFSLLYGIFTVVFSSYFFLFFKQKINKLITFGAGIFCIMTIVSFFGYTFFPLSEAGYAGTFQDIMHIIITAIVVVFTIISLMLFIIGFFRTKDIKYLGTISLCTFLLLLAGAMLINILPDNYFGIAQRINAFSCVIYTGILSICRA